MEGGKGKGKGKREKGREGIGEEGKENGDRPLTIFCLKVALLW